MLKIAYLVKIGKWMFHLMSLFQQMLKSRLAVKRISLLGRSVTSRLKLRAAR